MGKESVSVDELSCNLSFIRWVKGTALPAEVKKWDSWINSSPNNKKIAQEAQQRILGMNFVHSYKQNMNAEWSKLRYRIIKRNPILGFGSTGVENSHKNRSLKLTLILVVVTVAGFTAFFISRSGEGEKITKEVEWLTISTDYSQQKTVVLSDGSTITLNANSSIMYPLGWVIENINQVHLEGEAYFSIIPREQTGNSLFEVQTPDGTIQVVGTKFVVKTGSDKTNVALEEGTISILKKSKEVSSHNKKYQIKPNQLATFSSTKEGITIEEHSNIKLFSSWTNNELLLENSPFSYMVSRIKDIYGVEIKVLDQELCKRSLTGTVKLKDLEYVVASVAKVMDAEVSHKDGTLYFGNNNQ